MTPQERTLSGDPEPAGSLVAASPVRRSAKPRRSNRAVPFGERLYRLRLERGLSQLQVAELAKISPAYYSALENSKKRPPPDSTVDSLARALSLDDMSRADLAELAIAERFRIETYRPLPHVRDLVVLIRCRESVLQPALVEKLKQQIREAPT